MARQALSTVVEQARIAASRTVPDAELLEQFLTTGDEAAFAALVRRHRSTVLAACRQVLADDADVEDATQQTFLALWRNARSIRQRQSLGGWLFGVSHRLAVKELTLVRRRREVEAYARKARSESADAPDVSWREACAILHEELDRLPDKHRLPLLLCYLDGKSRDEAAKQLGWPVGSLRGHLERGRTRLRARLARRGVTLSAGLLAAAGTIARAGPALSSAAILKAVMEQTQRATAAFSLRRLVLLAALTVGISGGGVRLATSTHEEPTAPTRPPAQAVAEQPPTGAGQVTVSGRVLDADGKPIAGARLYGLRMRTGKIPFLAEENLESVAHGATGSDGRFRFDVPKDQLGKSPGGDPWPIMAIAEGFGIGWSPSSEAAEEVTIHLVKDQPIMGRVLDSEGRPVTDANIRIESLFTGPDDRLDAFLTGWKANWRDAWSHVPKRTLPPSDAVKVTPTDRDGRFRIMGVGAERLVTLEVQAPTVAKAKLHIVNRAGFDPKVHNQATADLRPRPLYTPQLYGPTFDFVMSPAKTLSGVVRTADGRPIEGAHVATSNIAWNTSITTTTTADGRFTLTGLTKQPSYYLHVSPRKTSPLLARSVNVPDTEGLQPVTAEVMLSRGVIVTGRVIDKETGKGVLSSLRFAPLPENKFFGKPGYDSYKYERLGNGTDKDGKFHLPIIPGAGVLIVQANSGESLDGQYLNPYMLATLDAEERKHVKVIEDGRNGYFSGAGNSYESLGTEHAVKYLDLAENAGTISLDLYLHRGKTAKLAIRDPQGQPLSGAVVGGVTAAWPITFAIQSAECPVYALDPAKPRTLAIYHPGRNLGASVLVRGDEAAPVVANLQPAGTVTGRILDADGEPIAGGDVIVSFPSYAGSELDRYRQQQRQPIRSDKDGRFKIDGVVPGLKFAVNNVRKGDTIFLPNPPRKATEVAAGEKLDLGDIRMVARPR